MIKSKKDLEILTNWMHDKKTRKVYVNGIILARDYYNSLLFKLALREIDITNIRKLPDTLYLQTN